MALLVESRIFPQTFGGQHILGVLHHERSKGRTDIHPDQTIFVLQVTFSNEDGLSSTPLAAAKYIIST
jgi:hypothetical protein